MLIPAEALEEAIDYYQAQKEIARTVLKDESLVLATHDWLEALKEVRGKLEFEVRQMLKEAEIARLQGLTPRRQGQILAQRFVYRYALGMETPEIPGQGLQA